MTTTPCPHNLPPDDCPACLRAERDRLREYERVTRDTILWDTPYPREAELLTQLRQAEEERDALRAVVLAHQSMDQRLSACNLDLTEENNAMRAERDELHAAVRALAGALEKIAGEARYGLDGPEAWSASLGIIEGDASAALALPAVRRVLEEKE